MSDTRPSLASSEMPSVQSRTDCHQFKAVLTQQFILGALWPLLPDHMYYTCVVDIRGSTQSLMKLLLVEDAPRLARPLLELLNEEGHSADWAEDGEHGLDLATNGEYDAIILDVMLPVMDGLAVCKTLRSRRIETPVLMVSARTSVDDRLDAECAGADDYLPKPFHFRELMERLLEIIGSRRL